MEGGGGGACEQQQGGPEERGGGMNNSRWVIRLVCVRWRGVQGSREVVRGHNTGHHCETLYVPPHRRWPHILSLSPPLPQNSDYQPNSEELRLVSEVQTQDLTSEVNSKLLPTCSIVWLSWLLYIPLFFPSIVVYSIGFTLAGPLSYSLGPPARWVNTCNYFIIIY